MTTVTIVPADHLRNGDFVLNPDGTIDEAHHVRVSDGGYINWSVYRNGHQVYNCWDRRNWDDDVKIIVSN